MRAVIQALRGRAGLASRAAAMFALLAVGNVAAWAWALAAFRDAPVLLGTALLAYGLGLRHAVDADHIAAIDNVVRKLMQEGRRPVAVGLFFALGHSTVVVLASVAIAVAAAAFKDRLAAFASAGAVAGTLVSAAFLLAIGAMNLFVLASVWRTFRRVRAGEPCADDDLNVLLAGRGIMARLFRPLFRLIRASWHMYPLGFLFGLGFDTATEVGLLGISASQASAGHPVWSILVFPALFTAGMSLADAADGVLMLGAYGWAFLRPVRKLWYNLTITLVSVLVALLVGGIEALGLAAGQLGLHGPVWDEVTALNGDFGAIGWLVAGVFAACWVVSAAIWRARGYGRLEVTPG